MTRDLRRHLTPSQFAYMLRVDVEMVHAWITHGTLGKEVRRRGRLQICPHRLLYWDPKYGGDPDA